MTNYFEKVQTEIMGDAVTELKDPPVPPPLVCKAYPLEYWGGTTPNYASCSDGVGGLYEFAHWCEGECEGHDSTMTLCCNKELGGSAYPKDDDMGIANCPAGTDLLVRWVSGDGSDDDDKITLCMDPYLANIAGLTGVTFKAYPVEEHHTYVDCPASISGKDYGPVVKWCSGDCNGDDAKVTICVQ